MKHIIQNISFYLLTISIVLLSSCGKTAPAVTDESCIPPVEKLAYPIGIPPSNEKNPEVGPLGDWQLQSSLPEPSKRENAPQIIARSNEVWVLPLDEMKIFRYSTNTREWKIYNTIDSFSVAPRNLLLARDGILWGIGTVTDSFDSQENFSLFSWYNEKNDQFEFVKDVDGLLDKVLVNSSPEYISEDESGLLWFFGSLPEGNDVGLYSFNPSTQKSEKHLSLPNGLIYAGPVITRDGIIWFYSGGSERQLLTYLPTTRQVQPHLGLPNLDELGHIWILFVDRNGRLWLDNKGWLEFQGSASPVWYKLIPSPVFLTDNGWFQSLGDGAPSRYGWELPLAISQSSNGWYWFTTFHGTIRLDPVKEEWCLFTTGSSPVVEDENGNLWIVVFGKLYKYPLNP